MSPFLRLVKIESIKKNELTKILEKLQLIKKSISVTLMYTSLHLSINHNAFFQP